LGRYGPYVERGGTYRNLRNAEEIFTVTLEGAIELLANKSGARVLKELGNHTESGVPVRILDGRYGPYVTDGTVNASIPKGADPEAVSMEEAVELLAASAKKGKGGRGRRGRTGGPAKEAPAASKGGAPKKKKKSAGAAKTRSSGKKKGAAGPTRASPGPQEGGDESGE
jgi:DNA topoisomerase-1